MSDQKNVPAQPPSMTPVIPPGLESKLMQLRHKRVKDLLDGAAQAPNPYAAFIVGKMKEVQGQAMSAAQQLQVVEGQAAALREHLTKLQGAVEQYLHDLHEWDRELEPQVPTTPPAPQNGVHESKPS